MAIIDYQIQLGEIYMIKLLSKNIIFVTGAKCSAIYTFNDGKVYSINEHGTFIMKKFFAKENLSLEEEMFINKIKELFNLTELDRKDFVVKQEKSINIDLAWLEVTQKCTSRCIHCYEGCIHEEVKKPLNFQQWQNIIIQLKQLKCKRIQFIGGEPTLYRRLPELIQFASDLGIGISIFTNLYCLSNTLFQTIIANNVTVHFSIYGSDASIHDSVTQVSGSYHNLIQNLNKLLKNNVNLVAHIVGMKENENDINAIYELLAKLNLSNIKYDEIRQVYGMSQNKHSINISKLTMKEPNFRCSLDNFNKACYRNTCWCNKCVISTNGDVFPCEFERNIKYGNVLSNLLIDILSKPLVQNYWNLNLNKVNICKDCEFRFACHNCRPLAYGINGNILDKSPRCSYNPYEGIW